MSDDSLVVIENQLERSNHDHLGKTLTYASVLGAKTIVWIAKTFTDEHRKAVEWLNELGKGDLRFYGVQLQVWRIGSSDPAPRFEIVCGPNEVVETAARARESSEASPTNLLHLDFWTEVRKALANTGAFSSLQSPRPKYWFDIAIGRAHVHIALIANTWDQKIGVRLYMNHKVAGHVLAQLGAEQANIEREIGSPLLWNPAPQKMDKTIRLDRSGDIADRSQWPELIEWLAGNAAAFKRAFGPRLAAMDFSAKSPDTDD